MEEVSIIVNEELSLHCCIWIPEKPPIGVVQIIHGISEYIQRYSDFADYLNGLGYVVVGEDHSGHGRSVTGEQIYGYLVGGWETAVLGIHSLFLSVRSRFPSLPYFMLGHSMGSFLLRTYLGSYGAEISGVILSGTGWQPAILLALGRILCAVESLRLGASSVSCLLQNIMFGPYGKKFAPNRTAYDWLSSDCSVVDAYVNDPLCGFPPSVQLCREMLKGISMIQSKSLLDNMMKTMPILLAAGQMDPVGGMGKGVMRTAEAFRAAGISRVDVKLYQNMRHEILNEHDKQLVYHDISAWMTECLSAADDGAL